MLPDRINRIDAYLKLLRDFLAHPAFCNKTQNLQFPPGQHRLFLIESGQLESGQWRKHLARYGIHNLRIDRERGLLVRRNLKETQDKPCISQTVSFQNPHRFRHPSETVSDPYPVFPDGLYMGYVPVFMEYVTAVAMAFFITSERSSGWISSSPSPKRRLWQSDTNTWSER